MKKFDNLPDIFTFFNGEKVLTALDWEKRRRELKEWFTENVFGKYPIGAEKGFTFSVDAVENSDRAIIKRISMHKGDYEGKFSLFLPPHVQNPPVLVYAVLKNYEDKFDLNNVDNYEKTPSVTSLPLGVILDRGYAVAAYFVSAAAPDEPDGERRE